MADAREVLRSYLQRVVNEADYHFADSVLASDLKFWSPDLVEPLLGRADFIERLKRNKVIFPDGKYEIHRVVMEAEVVVAEITFEGNQDGEMPTPLGPVAPSGLRVQIDGFVLAEVRDGVITEIKVVTDRFGQLSQLSALVLTPSGGG